MTGLACTRDKAGGCSRAPAKAKWEIRNSLTRMALGAREGPDMTAEGLERFAIFERLRAEELDRIAQRCRIVAVRQGEAIFQAKQDADAVYLVRSGSVELRFRVVYLNGSVEIPLEKVETGELFGWSAVIPPYTYTLTACATKDSELLRIRQADLQECCEDHPRIGYVLMQNIAQIIGKSVRMRSRGINSTKPRTNCDWATRAAFTPFLTASFESNAPMISVMTAISMSVFPSSRPSVSEWPFKMSGPITVSNVPKSATPIPIFSYLVTLSRKKSNPPRMRKSGPAAVMRLPESAVVLSSAAKNRNSEIGAETSPVRNNNHWCEAFLGSVTPVSVR